MKTYISGQITGLDISYAEYIFACAAIELEDQGHEAVNPMNILQFDESHTWKDYMMADIKELFDCEAIYMLNNWTRSRGARVERAIAFELGLQIIYQP